MESFDELKQQFEGIFHQIHLGDIHTIEFLEGGFRHKLLEINLNYIIKICKSPELESDFTKEIQLTQYFQNDLPVPEIIHQDCSKSSYPYYFYIYKKIKGASLCSIWHLYPQTKQKSILADIISLQRTINQSDLSSILPAPERSWYELRTGQLNHAIEQVEHNKLLSKNMLSDIRHFIHEKAFSLHDCPLLPVYTDFHFGNFLISNDQIAGILDLESIAYSSIDFCLDIFLRMLQYPHLYMPESLEHLADQNDYIKAQQDIRTLYPEAFDLPHFEERIQMYALEYDLKLLARFPHSREIIERIKVSLS